MYKCGGCNRILKKLDPATGGCSYCGSRIVYKVRSETVRTVKAR